MEKAKVWRLVMFKILIIVIVILVLTLTLLI